MDVKPLIRRKALSFQQRRLLAFCDLFLTQEDQMPTGQAIADHFGWASQNAAYEAMASLERRGLIERNSLGKWRFTEAGRRLLPECAPPMVKMAEQSDSR
jgi:Mn-dependent DtxR family transcriptional regulator